MKVFTKKHGLTERFSRKKIMGNENIHKDSEFLINLGDYIQKEPLGLFSRLINLNPDFGFDGVLRMALATIPRLSGRNPFGH